MNTQRTSLIDGVFYLTLLVTGLAMAAALAHALELPNKMGLPREEYFIVQKIYRGWDRLGFLIGAELIGMLGLLYFYRRSEEVRVRAVLAILSLAAAQAVFWLYTFPANQLTANWTLQPENWETLRAQWEYSHLTGAIFQTLAFAFLLCALFAASRAADQTDAPVTSLGLD